MTEEDCHPPQGGLAMTMAAAGWEWAGREQMDSRILACFDRDLARSQENPCFDNKFSFYRSSIRRFEAGVNIP